MPKEAISAASSGGTHRADDPLAAHWRGARRHAFRESRNRSRGWSWPAVALIRERSGSSLFQGTAGVQIALKHDLRGQLVAPGLALPGQAGARQAPLGFERGVPLVEIDDRPVSHRGRPVPNSRARPGRLRGRWCVKEGRPPGVRRRFRAPDHGNDGIGLGPFRLVDLKRKGASSGRGRSWRPRARAEFRSRSRGCESPRACGGGCHRANSLEEERGAMRPLRSYRRRDSISLRIQRRNWRALSPKSFAERLARGTLTPALSRREREWWSFLAAHWATAGLRAMVYRRLQEWT